MLSWTQHEYLKMKYKLYFGILLMCIVYASTGKIYKKLIKIF